jgi:hypothetical protein
VPAVQGIWIGERGEHLTLRSDGTAVNEPGTRRAQSGDEREAGTWHVGGDGCPGGGITLDLHKPSGGIDWFALCSDRSAGGDLRLFYWIGDPDSDVRYEYRKQ